MRTIGKHRPKDAPYGDFIANCDYCGVPMQRSRMIRDGAGFLACPKDARGGDVVTISEENAARAGHPNIAPDPVDGGNYNLGPVPGPPPTVYRP